MEGKYIKESRVVQTHLVLPNETNNHASLFGGILMRNMDEIASIAARRFCRSEVVTASTDSVDFLHPIYQIDSVCLEAFVTWTGTSSMEVFVKVIAENLDSGKRRIAATAFLTFVALDSNGKPKAVPKVIPETEEERKLHETGQDRAMVRKNRKIKSKELAEFITVNKPWE